MSRSEIDSAVLEGSLAKLCEDAVSKLTYGSNIRASAEYRRHIAAILLRRGIEKIISKEESGK